MSRNIPNLDKLIARFRTLRVDQFNMAGCFMVGGREPINTPDLNECGTAACIMGWCAPLADAPIGGIWSSIFAAEWLGLTPEQAHELFFPDGCGRPDLFPPARAIDVLCHLRDTGEVRWDLFPAENYRAQPWSAPQAIETPPTLPASITRLLAPEPTPAAEEI